MRRFAAVAERAEKDPTACAELARMITQLSPHTSIAEVQEVRAEIEKVEADELRTAHPSLEHDEVANQAKQQGVGTIQWLRRSAVAVANYCSA
jgi:hypothetical protein